jgi:NAD-dependent deacetylase
MPLCDQDRETIDRIVDLLERSSSVFFVTGAGISADSGLPTYRGIGGLYNAETTEDGRPIEELLSGGTMRRQPELTWKYLSQIERACRGARCNRGHEVIAEMEAHFERLVVLTQNVDGLHRQAGSKEVIDIHGDLHNLLCTRCDFRQTLDDFSDLKVPPRCPECDAIIRPDVVLFGEMLPPEKVERLYAELDRGFDIVFSVGTTSVFPYIAAPVVRAAYLGKPSIEINPGVSEVSRVVTVRLALGAATALDAVWSRFRERSSKRPN